jgi:hypothetical protein
MPAGNAVVFSVAVAWPAPAAFRLMLPSWAELFLKDTVPVGVAPLVEETVAVNPTVCPQVDIIVLRLRAVVVGSIATV